ncbi:MAG TPA: YIP1 family protein [Planctomycetota bacterium]|nr:YIP1 family protein [Planctomycetota bacterium]
MEIRCPYCEKTVQVPGGGQFTCPNCRAVFAVDMAPPTPTQAPTIPSPPPLPPPLPGAAPAPPPGPSAGPACAKHPDRTAAEVCKRCGNFMCPACAMPYQTGRYCPDCMPLMMGGYGGAVGTVAWEQPAGGLLGSFWNTAIFCLRSPEAFWRGVQPEGPLGQPCGFLALGTGLFLSPLYLLMAVFYFFFMGLIAASMGPKIGPQFAAMQGVMAGGMAVAAVLVPAFSVIGLFISSAFYHLVALICGAQRGYGTTLRILGYTHGSVAPATLALGIMGMFLQFVPCLGPLLNLCVQMGFVVWVHVILYHGFRTLHGFTQGKAIVCILWWIPFICCGFMLLVFLVFGAAAAAPGAGGGGF